MNTLAFFIPIFSCGDISKLGEIVKKLFWDKADYFNDFSTKELLEYIYKNCGKRLVSLKNYKGVY